jgi:hypothetical protein
MGILKVKPRHKRGALSNLEKNAIREMADKNMPLPEIAEHLGGNRKVATVKRFLKKEGIGHQELSITNKDYYVYEKKLKSKKYWKEIEQQLDKKELDYFSATWINFMIQFKDNILFAEELQLKQLIIVDILLHRTMKERRKHSQDMERLQKMVDDEYTKDKNNRDVALLAQLETQLSYARNSLSSYTSEYTKLLDKQKDINKDLKMTRDQRIKKVEDSKTTFSGLLKALEDEAIRERTGYDIGVMKLAKEKAREEMSEYHEYIDGKVDQPFLTPDTIKDD